MGDGGAGNVDALLALLAQNQAGGGIGGAQMMQPQQAAPYRGGGPQYQPSSSSYDALSRMKPTSRGVINISDMLALANSYSGGGGGDRSRYSPVASSRDYYGGGGRGRSPSPPPRRQQRPPSGSGPHITETMTFNSSMVGRVIGRGGESLRKIEKESGARVQFIPEKDTKPGERSADIMGSKGQVDYARNAILELIGSRQAEVGSEATNARIMFTVPDRCVGLIIGRGGESVGDIQRRSGARVNIVPENEAVNGHRPINLYGSPDAVTHARHMIEEIVDHDLDGGASGGGGGGGGSVGGGSGTRASGSMRDKPPAAVDIPRDGTSEVIKVPNEAVGMIIGKGGDTVKDIQNQSQARVHIAGEPTAAEPNVREITLVGSVDAVTTARKIIEHKLQTQPWSAKAAHGVSAPTQTGAQYAYGQAAQPQQAAATNPNDPYAAFGGYEAVAAYWAQQAALQQQQQHQS